MAGSLIVTFVYASVSSVSCQFEWMKTNILLGITIVLVLFFNRIIMTTRTNHCVCLPTLSCCYFLSFSAHIGDFGIQWCPAFCVFLAFWQQSTLLAYGTIIGFCRISAGLVPWCPNALLLLVIIIIQTPLSFLCSRYPCTDAACQCFPVAFSLFLHTWSFLHSALSPSCVLDISLSMTSYTLLLCDRRASHMNATCGFHCLYVLYLFIHSLFLDWVCARLLKATGKQVGFEMHCPDTRSTTCLAAGFSVMIIKASVLLACQVIPFHTISYHYILFPLSCSLYPVSLLYAYCHFTKHGISLVLCIR